MFVSDDMNMSTSRTFLVLSEPSNVCLPISQGRYAPTRVRPTRSLFTSHLCLACILALGYSSSNTGLIRPNEHGNVLIT
jgi:hypothetical protein